MRTLLIGSLVTLALAVAACGSSNDSASTSTAAATAAKQPAAAPARSRASPWRSRAADRGTDKPAYPAVLREQQPDERQGLRERGRLRGRREARVRQEQVKWISVPFNSSYAPGRRSSTSTSTRSRSRPSAPERVDFSMPYFTAPQAVVARRRSAAAKAKSLADLARPSSACRSAPRASTRSTRRSSRRKPAADLQQLQRHVRGAEDRPGRRDRRRPPDRLLRDRGAGPRARRSSGSSRRRAATRGARCSPRARS